MTERRATLPIAEAREQLEAAGYYVEYGYHIMYVRTKPTAMCDRIYAKGDSVSKWAVDRLLRKAPNNVSS